MGDERERLGESRQVDMGDGRKEGRRKIRPRLTNRP